MFAPVVALIVSLAFTRLLIQYPRIFKAIDYPNARSLHTVPTPRTGGVGILVTLLSIGLGWIVVRGFGTIVPGIAAIVGGVVLLGFIAFWDDLRTIQPLLRLGAQCLVVVVVLTWNGFFLPPLVQQFLTNHALWIGMVTTLVIGVAVVWMINLYNFMDGMDGFASGMAVAGFTTFAVIGFLNQSFGYAGVMATVAASSAGFLWYNFPPAKIFLGDVGSTTLGYGAAMAALWGWKQGFLPLWTSVIIFSPFIMDATVTLIKRLIAGSNIFVAHREHYYQRIVRVGWGHRKTVLWEYGAMVLASLAALLSLTVSSHSQLGIVVVILAAFSMVFIIVDYWVRPILHKA